MTILSPLLPLPTGFFLVARSSISPTSRNMADSRTTAVNAVRLPTPVEDSKPLRSDRQGLEQSATGSHRRLDRLPKREWR